MVELTGTARRARNRRLAPPLLHENGGAEGHRSAVEKDLDHPRAGVAGAEQAGMLGGPTARLLIITAGWTGCR
ncbi:hypothetical protein [Amycolatopsis taiwanensis]|uniref:Uncharacterized protein n=1 Tax=Amycolatopsis taiwanensis TaxID=342230 RepID=A0A9W6VGM5_9PSEU|nr:hypothetical protein [Amycolatopsis taiwanensis]GLY67910.1 hypothetical protein Atai01_45290 [Amycolatopsis taiwanensis]